MTNEHELIAAFMSEIEPDAGVVIETYIEEPRTDRAELSFAVEEYVEHIRGSAARETVNVERAEEVAEGCRALLAGPWDDDSGEWRVAQAAVRYFLEEEDADYDMESLTGFDDDAAVVAAAVRVLGA
jgi:uncharacterized membrane protein YkvA (DUF1232 family)